TNVAMPPSVRVGAPDRKRVATIFTPWPPIAPKHGRTFSLYTSFLKFSDGKAYREPEEAPLVPFSPLVADVNCQEVVIARSVQGFLQFFECLLVLLVFPLLSIQLLPKNA